VGSSGAGFAVRRGAVVRRLVVLRLVVLRLVVLRLVVLRRRRPGMNLPSFPGTVRGGDDNSSDGIAG
jgi:hypothetical protein